MLDDRLLLDNKSLVEENGVGVEDWHSIVSETEMISVSHVIA